MVDLDQCTHATINGCDKERRGWYPLPSSLFPSICLPSCPACCPLPNCFSPTLVHLHLHWHLPGGGPSAGAAVPLMEGAPDVLSAVSIHLPQPAPSENSEPSFYQAYHKITASSPPRPPSSTYLTLSFSPGLAQAVSHMLISHGCTHSLQPYREFLLLTFDALLECTVYRVLTSSDDATASLPHGIWVHMEKFFAVLFHPVSTKVQRC